LGPIRSPAFTLLGIGIKAADHGTSRKCRFIILSEAKDLGGTGFLACAGFAQPGKAVPPKRRGSSKEFDLAYNLARFGYKWSKYPPGYEP